MLERANQAMFRKTCVHGPLTTKHRACHPPLVLTCSATCSFRPSATCCSTLEGRTWLLQQDWTPRAACRRSTFSALCRTRNSGLPSGFPPLPVTEHSSYVLRQRSRQACAKRRVRGQTHQLIVIMVGDHDALVKMKCRVQSPH